MALKDIPQQFVPDSEEDLRFAIAQYFHDLGFDQDELSFEDHFSIRLGHNTLVITREGVEERERSVGRSDILVTRNGSSLAIVETKAPDHPLTDQDAQQAISYARLLLQIAPYAIVTNGMETQVYDTLADEIEPLNNPADSLWSKNGQRIPTISDDLKFNAARLLIGINTQTLKSFCQKQVAQSLEDLKGSIYESRFYIPEVYLPRQEATKAFRDWLQSDLPCFAVIGESGVGKTNFMCATAEDSAQNSFVLFYRAARLTEGLLISVCNDFAWEFHRERHAAYIIERFDGIAQQHNQHFIIFVDGLDEFPGNRNSFKAELIDLVTRLKGRAVKLCLSCKLFDWPDFVIDRGQTYNQLARAIYPTRNSVHSPQEISQPKSTEVGTCLPNFNDDELGLVFPKYKDAFSLQGELRGNTRIECQMPLTLRFVAEVYRNCETDLPAEITGLEVFDAYWNKRLNQVEKRLDAEQILIELSNLCIELGEKQVRFSALRERLVWTDSMTAACEDLVRFGLLQIIDTAHDPRRLAFVFEKIRSYTFSVKAQEWPFKEPRDTARAICNSLRNIVGVEAVEFYLNIIDRGETSVLTELALLEFDCFLQLMDSLELKSSILPIPKDKLQEVLMNRLEQYAVSYSEISRRYFPDICERIPPYSRGEVGIWIYRSSYQFRTRTEAYPQPVVVLSDEVFAGLWNHNLPLPVHYDLQPNGTMYMGMDDIAEQLPQKLAWERMRSEVASLFTHRFLNETNSPLLLKERIWETLLYEPSTWFEGEPNVGRRFYQMLDFEDIQEVQTLSIAELMTRVRDLGRRYMTLFPANTSLRELEVHQRGSYFKNLALRRVYYWLELLHPLCEHLAVPKVRSDDLYAYLRTDDLTPAVTTLETLISDILAAYQTLLLSNFSQIADRFALFKFSGRPILVEVTNQPGGDFLKVCYTILTTANLPELYLVYVGERHNSLTSLPLVRKTAKGTITSYGDGFGKLAIAQQVGDLYIEEPEAFAYFTRFPSRKPLLDQVYQLLGFEAEFLLGGKFNDWSGLEYPTENYTRLDQWIAEEWRIRNAVSRHSNR